MRPVLVALLLALVPAFAAAQAASPDSVNARVIVKFRETSTLLRQQAATAAATHATRAQALAARIGRPLAAGAGLSDRAQVVTATGVSSEDLAQQLSAEPDVEYAVPDRRRRVRAAPNDPLYLSGGANGPAAGQWYLRAPSGNAVAAIDAESAWNVTTGSPSIVVADIDTGVRYEHPDLLRAAAGGNLPPGYDMIADVPSANDGDGRDADASDPGDWITATEANDPRGPFYQCTEKDPGTGKYVAEDSDWHGTQVAGIIAAITNNGTGMASVGRSVRLLPVRSLGKCGGYDSDIIAGSRWAAGLAVPGVPANPNPARVINLSLGGEDPCLSSYQDAINEMRARNVVIVAAAGNSGGHAVGVPANCAGVIAVGGLRHVGTKVGFSSLGPEVALSAPAGNCVNVDGGPCLYPILTTTDTGATTPVSPTYSDAYNASTGTSFSSPLVAGTVALMLSVQPSLTPDQVKLLLQGTARNFPATAADAAPGEVIPQCTAPRTDPTGQPIDQLQCTCTTTTCGAGMLDAGGAVRAAATGFPAGGLSAQGLWWNAPANSESGWGIFLAHQGDVIFAAWYTYDATGRAVWLTMTANRTGSNAYAGTIYRTTGPPFSSVPFDPSRVAGVPVGAGTLTFANADFATFAYTVAGIAQTKRITRQAFGPMPACAWNSQPNLALATNAQDLWWNAPANSESGWGLSITQQGDALFAVWYTYDIDGSPLWLSSTMTRTGAGGWTGALYRTLGPAFSAVPFDPAAVVRTTVGNATLAFADGNAGTFSYTVNGVAGQKAITRQVFRPPGTICQ